MAEISSAQALPPGHLQSPLFKLIPTEVRLDIYRHAFAGSEVVLSLHPDAPKLYNSWSVSVASRASRSKPMPVGGRRSVFCTSGHLRDLKYQLLLTCKQIYDEALAIYWSETIVCNDKGYFSRGLFFERIPDFAKLHIKHLRDVQTCANPGVKSLRGIAFSRQASFAEALESFPKLQTCSVREGLAPEPSEAVELALARHPKIHFLKVYSELKRRGEVFDDHFWPGFYEVCF